MEYITEVRGWDEWSNKYEVILDVIEGREFEQFVKDDFVNYLGYYPLSSVDSLAEFENIVDTSSMTIGISKI